jgi:hypothetical protein
VGLKACQGEILLLRYLVAGPGAVPRQTTLAASKEVIWRIGRGVERDVDAGARGRYWETAASMVDHKMTGQQLQQLHRTMQQQGYQSPARPPGVELPSSCEWRRSPAPPAVMGCLPAGPWRLADRVSDWLRT